jgi:hypothetical protein
MLGTLLERRRRLLRALPLLVAATAVGSFASAASASTDFYVSPTGSDRNRGSLRHPFKTLQRAQTAVRALTPTMRDDIIVHLRGGTYDMARPLTLSDAAGDSGRNGHEVVYRAHRYGTRRQERPVISGGQAVRGWRLVDARRKIWKADVGELAPRQLYRNGKRLDQGRLDAIPGTFTRTRTGYVTDSVEPQSWANPADVEFVYTTFGYSQPICGVESITGTATETTITMDQPCFEWISTYITYNSEDPSAPLELDAPSPVKNSVSFLTEPRTWAVEHSTAGPNSVYYRARAGENPNAKDFVVPARQTFVEGGGTTESPLHDVAFEGLTFTYSTWEGPNEDTNFPHYYADYYYDGGSPSGSLEEPTVRYRVVPAALTFSETRALRFEGNRFTNLGGDGLLISGPVDNVVRGNVFDRLAAGGFKLTGPELGTPGNLIENNLVHDVGNDYEGSVGVYLENVVDSIFRHNQIDETPYSGLVHAGLGTDTLEQTLDEPPGHGMQILDNRVFDTVNVMMDGGGIYTAHKLGTSWENGARIEGNEVFGVTNARVTEVDPNGEIGAPNALYTDVDSDFITLTRNVVYDSHQTWGGVYPARMRFSDSFWDDDQLVFYGSTDRLEIGDNTLLDADRPRRACRAIPACAAIIREAGLQPGWKHLLRLRG